MRCSWRPGLPGDEPPEVSEALVRKVKEKPREEWLPLPEKKERGTIKDNASPRKVASGRACAAGSGRVSKRRNIAKRGSITSPSSSMGLTACIAALSRCPKDTKTLRSRGVRTVINLRDDPVSDEQSDALAAGLTYVHISTSPGKIEPDKIRQFLYAVQTSPCAVFVHCAFGCDRTGLEIAMYRIVIEKWPREQAIGELYKHGYHWAVYPGIVHYLRTFPMSDYPSPS